MVTDREAADFTAYVMKQPPEVQQAALTMLKATAEGKYTPAQLEALAEELIAQYRQNNKGN